MSMSWDDRQYYAEKQAKYDACSHENLEYGRGWMTGEPRHLCLDCGLVIIKFAEDYDDYVEGDE